MKSLLLVAAVAAALAAVAPLASQAQPAPNGEALFTARCGVCHDSGAGPARAVLATHTPAQIVDILTNGVMSPMASGLSDAEKQAIAGFLTKASAAPAPAAPATDAPATNAPATTSPGG